MTPITSEIKKFTKQNFLILGVFCFAVVFIFIYILSNRNQELFIYGYEIMDFAYNLSLSIIAATIFFILQVYIPERNKKKEIKTYIKMAIVGVKYKIISSLLRVLGVDDQNDLLGTLAGNHQQFAQYFTREDNSIIDWYNLMNKLYENKYKMELGNITTDIEIFYHDINQFIMTVPNVNDQYAFREISALRHMIFPILKPQEMQVVDLANLLWFLLAGHHVRSRTSDTNNQDFLDDVINKI